MELKIKDFLYFYRILNWKHKISSIRPLGYALFGYTMAAKFEPIPLAANTLAVIGALLFWYCLNDYSDLGNPKEESYMKSLIKSGKITSQKALTLCLLPLSVTPLVLLTASKLSILLFALLLVTNTIYSIPPLRLKKRKYWGIIITTVAAPLLFLESASLGTITLQLAFMAAIVGLFSLYLETFHILEDFQTGEQVKKVKNPEFGLKLLKIIPVASLIASLVFALYFPVFLITSFFSIVRIFSLKGLRPHKIFKARRNFLSPELSLYEFALYAVLIIARR